jgi:hypothetical protein
MMQYSYNTMRLGTMHENDDGQQLNAKEITKSAVFLNKEGGKIGYSGEGESIDGLPSPIDLPVFAIYPSVHTH